ncbi:SMP-30/gluconolactonase/LRE family protein [Fortiea contorta]|uniref:SMP-30/gluconolactonase/LRE family protein n=1 Tax=Fortiea contorta TaxID=1892405 RepID=UPI0003473A8D|nr:SMP-30/gluconolactonase/LRE family protein [Fortiea contorta]
MLGIKTWIKQKLAVGYTKAESEKFYTLISPTAKPQRLATGFQFLEGPVWLQEQKCLLFSDIPGNKILQMSAGGEVKIFREPSNNSNGLTRDLQGRLIICESQTRRLTRLEKDGTITVLADQFQGEKLNAPNDVVVKSDGSIYFTDPLDIAIAKQQDQPQQRVYRFSPDSQQLTVVADDFQLPNGLAFSPDEKQLYIDDSMRRHIRVFDVQAEGTLTNSRIFHDMNIPQPGLPDGMKVDIQGNVYCTGAGGIWVFDANGSHLGTIVTPEPPANCAWGDDDYQSLYITACTSVYKIRVNIPGK